VKTILVFLFVLLFFACNENTIREAIHLAAFNLEAMEQERTKIIRPEYCADEQSMLDSGLVDLQKIDSTILVSLRYSDTANFLHTDVYGKIRHCFLQAEVAAALALAQQELKKRFPNYTLLVFDGARPMHIQRIMWDTLKMPAGQKQKYLSNPAKGGSLHNYGAAVDLSIADSNGVELDMGTPYDFFGEQAHPEKEAALLASGELSSEQIANRQLLREVMKAGKFWGIQTEWWHFNYCTRNEAMEKYPLVR
jgi:zinc D-Ala-D-Ala dipeptidase